MSESDPSSGAQPMPDQPMSAPQPVPPPYGVGGYGYGYGPMPINNNLGWAIGGMFVCWPFGIPSLIKSLQVQSLWMQGQTQQAEQSAADAKKWGKIGVIVGAAGYGLIILFYVVGIIVAIAAGIAEST